MKYSHSIPGPGFTKILKLMLKLRHIISVFVSREIMLKLVFSKVISGENKLKLSICKQAFHWLIPKQFLNSHINSFINSCINSV